MWRGQEGVQGSSREQPVGQCRSGGNLREVGSSVSPPALPAIVWSGLPPLDTSLPGPNCQPIKWPLKEGASASLLALCWGKEYPGLIQGVISNYQKPVLLFDLRLHVCVYVHVCVCVCVCV